MESEFIAAERGVQDAMGCYYLVKELGMDITTNEIENGYSIDNHL